MSKRISNASPNQRLKSPSLQKPSPNLPRRQELKVCSDCQTNYSHKASHNCESDKPLQTLKKSYKSPIESPNKDNLHYLSLLTHEMNYTSDAIDNGSDIGGNDREYVRSPQLGASYGDKKRFQDTTDLNTNDRGKILRVNDLVNKNDRVLANSYARNKESLIGQSPTKRVVETQNSAGKSFRGNVQDSGYEKTKRQSSVEEAGEERFVEVSENFNSDLDKVALKLESNIKKNFEKTAHSILHTHLNKQSLLEGDDTYRNREPKSLASSEDQYSRYKRRNLASSELHEKKQDTSYLSRSYISDKYPKDQATRDDYPLKHQEKSATIPSSTAREWESPKHQSNNIKVYTKDTLQQLSSSQEGFKTKESNDVKKSVVFKGTNERQFGHLRGDTVLSIELASAGKEPINIEEGASIRKINERLKAQSKPVAKVERYLLSPPRSGLNTNKDSYRKDNEYASSRENVDNELEDAIKERLAEKAEGHEVIEEDPQTEDNIERIEEIGIDLIREQRYEEAVEFLLEAEMRIRNELPSSHPQHLYIYYLLGECYIKGGDYNKAEKILDQAIQRYEQNSETENENDGTRACYYLGLLVLQSHIYMSVKSFKTAIWVYKKLVKGVETYWEDRSTQRAMRIIPHILLIKYNMGECFRNMDKLDEADEVFYEILDRFNIRDEEQLENYSVLLNIAEYFISRQKKDLALEALRKISEIGSYRETIEKSDPELFTLIYDEIAAILYNRGEYEESTKYYELSFKLKVKLMGMKHLKVGYSLLALGKAYYMNQEHVKALQRFTSGLEIIESIEGRNTVYSASISLTMARILFNSKEYHKATTLYERGLDIYSHILGYSHPYCLRIYINLIFVSFECNNSEKAVDIGHRLIKAVGEARNAEIFALLNEVGNIYRKNSFHEEAIRFYDVALKKYADMDHGGMAPEAAYLVYINIASANYHQRKHGDALQYYREAAKFFSEYDGGVSYHLASIYINIVRVYKALGKNNEASMYIKKAVTIIGLLEKETGGPGNDENLELIESTISRNVGSDNLFRRL